jgi:UDP-N-acetylmuramoyl-tripeptide--D-alanyl-D-alanine ligase
MKYFWTRFLPSYPTVLLYMLQDTEYRLGRYLGWYHRVDDFRLVMKRRTLEVTRKVWLLRTALWLLVVLIGTAVVVLMYVAMTEQMVGLFLIGLALLLAAPFVLAYGIVLPLFLGWLLIQKPREKMIIATAQKILNQHPARRIAIVGSFGKTTAKEMLHVVMGERLHVAATPGNMNTAIGISRFARTLQGNEDVLIFELGEEKVGDVRRLSRLTRPDFAVMTGINEAHLSSFGTLENTVGTIFEIDEFVPPRNLYKNAESPLVKRHKNKSKLWFSKKVAGEWRVSHVETSIEGTTFSMKRKKETMRIQTGLIGVHTVGVTAAVAALAYDFGLRTQDIERGMRKVRPFEHRMDPRPMHGAWIIDDTYNGNSQGVAAGLAFLKKSGARRRVYVTPGLVEQGSKTQEVHEEIGVQIASSADVVVLMQNSVTEYIKTGLQRRKFKGKLIEVDAPLQFYTNLDQFVAAGDIVLMQNDWTDNYQ